MAPRLDDPLHDDPMADDEPSLRSLERRLDRLLSLAERQGERLDRVEESHQALQDGAVADRKTMDQRIGALERDQERWRTRLATITSLGAIAGWLLGQWDKFKGL